MSEVGVSTLLLAAGMFAVVYAVAKLGLALALKSDVRKFREMCEAVLNDPRSTEEDRQVVGFYIRSALDWKQSYAMPMMLLFSPFLLIVALLAGLGDRGSHNTVHQARRELADLEREEFSRLGVDVNHSPVWHNLGEELRSLSTSVFLSRAAMTALIGAAAAIVAIPIVAFAGLVYGSAFISHRMVAAVARYLGVPAAKTMIEADIRIRGHHHRARGY